MQLTEQTKDTSSEPASSRVAEGGGTAWRPEPCDVLQQRMLSYCICGQSISCGSTGDSELCRRCRPRPENSEMHLSGGTHVQMKHVAYQRGYDVEEDVHEHRLHTQGRQVARA